MSRHRARGFDVRRVYEDGHDGNGYRVLVDRLWPRGMKKDAAALDEWARDTAPSAELRRWNGHDRSKFEEFVQCYPRGAGTPAGVGCGRAPAQPGSGAARHSSDRHSRRRALRRECPSRPPRGPRTLTCHGTPPMARLVQHDLVAALAVHLVGGDVQSKNSHSSSLNPWPSGSMSIGYCLRWMLGTWDSSPTTSAAVTTTKRDEFSPAGEWNHCVPDGR
jgi:hypothetical protein